MSPPASHPLFNPLTPLLTPAHPQHLPHTPLNPSGGLAARWQERLHDVSIDRTGPDSNVHASESSVFQLRHYIFTVLYCFPIVSFYFVVNFVVLLLSSSACRFVPSLHCMSPLLSLHSLLSFYSPQSLYPRISLRPFPRLHPLRRSLTLLFSSSSPSLRFYLTFISLLSHFYLTFISLDPFPSYPTSPSLTSDFTFYPRDCLCQVRFRTNAYDASTKGWSLGGKAPAWSVNGQQPGNERGGLRDNNVKDDGFVPTSHQRALRALESIPYESDWHRAQRADAAWTPMAPAAVSATGMRCAPFLACLHHLRLLHAATT